MNQPPAGQSSSTPLPTGAPSTQTTLPGVQKTPGSDAALPHTTQVGPRPSVPAFWQDRGNMMAQVLRVYEDGGSDAAKRLRDFLNEEIRKIEAGH